MTTNNAYLLFNTEIWHGITQTDIESFEKIYEILLKGLGKAHSKGPIVALYLEFGQLPIRYIWASRSIMYLQTILKRNQSELTNKIYKAQQEDPSKGDYCELVANFIEEIELKLTNDEIEKTSKNKFKKIVKTKAKEAALKYLNKQKEDKETGKMKDLKYTKLETQKYMTSPLFCQEDASLLLRLRTRCVNGIRNDFGAMFVDKNCPVDPECKTTDTLSHLLDCKKLQSGIKDHTLSTHRVDHKDIFSRDILRQKQATSLFQQLLKEGERVLSAPTAEDGPLLCGDAFWRRILTS